MGKRGANKVGLDSFSRDLRLNFTRAVEVEEASDGVAEDIILDAVSVRTKLTLIGSMNVISGTMMSSVLSPNRRRKHFGRSFDGICPTASGSQAPKRRSK